jgi:hypothetical protein
MHLKYASEKLSYINALIFDAPGEGTPWLLTLTWLRRARARSDFRYARRNWFTPNGLKRPGIGTTDDEGLFSARRPRDRSSTTHFMFGTKAVAFFAARGISIWIALHPALLSDRFTTRGNV